jgi:hypothetical protein
VAFWRVLLFFPTRDVDKVDGSGRAWLLEVNCPPSQDTATGLPHAEALHDGVLGDLLDK